MPSWKNAQRSTWENERAIDRSHRYRRYRCHGPGHRPARCLCRAVGAALRQPPGGGAASARADRHGPCPAGGAGPAGGGGCRARDGQSAGGRGLAGPRRLPVGDRGDRREPGGQAGVVPPIGRGGRRRSDPRQQYLLAVGYRDRLGLSRSRPGRRSALLQSGAADASGGGDRGSRHPHRHRRATVRPGGDLRPPGGACHGQPRLHRQPCRTGLRHRGAAYPRRGRGAGGGDRRSPARGRRLPHGPVRAVRPGRVGRQPAGDGVDLPAVLRGAALSSASLAAPDARRRPPGAQERPGLLPLRRRWAGARRRPGGCARRGVAAGVAGRRRRT